jgi:anti-sigma factor RsiW
MKQGKDHAIKDNRRVAGLWCTEVLLRLSEFLDGTLPTAEIDAARAHVEGCDNCARFGAEFSAAVALLRSGIAPVTPPSGASERIRGRLGL